MGEMADYFIDSMIDEELAVRNPFAPYPGELCLEYTPAPRRFWYDGDGACITIRSMSDDHLGAAIGWCLKHFPEESRDKVAELKAEQVRREFSILEEE